MIMRNPPLSFFCRRASFVLTGLLFLVFAGCHSSEGIHTTVLAGGKVVFTHLAVLPFQEVAPEDANARMASCPVCGNVFQTDGHAPGAAKVVEDIVLEKLREHKQFAVIAPGAAERDFPRPAAGGPVSAEAWKKAGKELGADGILIGYVFRLRERKGRSYSVAKPASVAFDLHLVRVSDGALVWRGSFDRTQSSLMENLGRLSSFYKWGIKWLTAKELATEGVDEILKEFPGIKDSGA